MSTLVRTTGVTTAQGAAAVSHGRRVQFKLSNGNTLLIGHDTNTSATGGQGDNTGVSKLYVYEKNGATGVVTLRATITDPAGGNSIYSGTLFANNDLGIMVRSTDAKTVQYCKMTYATYAVSAFETAYTAGATSTIGFFDIDASDADTVGMALQTFDTSDNSLWIRMGARLAAAATWTMLGGSASVFGTRNVGLEGCSVVMLGNTGTTRRMVGVFGQGRVGKDNGYTHVTVSYNESNNTGVTINYGVAVYAADTAPTAAQGMYSRNVMCYRTATDEYVAFGSQTGDSLRLDIQIATFTGVWTLVNSDYHRDVLGGVIPAFNHSDGLLTLLFFHASGTWRLQNKIFKRSANKYDLVWSSYFTFDNDERELNSIGSGGNRNGSQIGHDVLVQYRDVATNVIRIKLASSSVVTDGANSIISSLVPSDGALDQIGTPVIKTFFDSTKYRVKEQSRYKIEWQFATNNTFTTGLQTYLQADGKFQLVEPGQPNFISDTLPAPYSLSGGIWYQRARMVNEYGDIGPWSAVQSFVVEHPPTMVPISPDNSALGYTTGDVTFVWEFTDPFPGDYQTARQVQILTSDLATVITDTGKVVSAVKNAILNVAAAYKTQLLAWRVKGWDSMDDAGNFSDAKFFTMYDVPTIVINSPAAGATVTTGVPNIQFTPTVGNARTIKEYEVFVLKAGSVVWSSGKIAGTFNSGVAQNVKVGAGKLQDGQSYTIQISVTDSVGITVLSAPQTFIVDWVPPASPTSVAVTTTFYNTDDEGYVSVTWADAAREVAAFVRWEVWRRDDLIDPDTLTVLQVGLYKLVHNEYNINASYEFKDYYAPSNYKVNYIVRQVVNRDGNEIDSANNDSVSAFPKSDGYWLLSPNTDNTDVDAFKMSIVTGDTYTDEQEEAVFTVIGKGRVVNKGEDLGPSGSLNVQLRNTGGTTARQKKLRLETIQETVNVVWLRNPFGDTFPVNVSSIQVARVAGVGAAEFCDVTIPYAQVGE